MLNRIIVPLDGSQLSHAALPLARSLVEMTGAGVTLLSVIDPPRDFYVTAQDSSNTRMRPQDIDHLASEEKRLEDYLEGVRTTFDTDRVSIDVRLGEPADQILNAAESSDGAAIVMASHGRTGLGRMFLGSVANRIVQATEVPVFIIRASEDSRAEYGKMKFSHIAVPLDGSKLAEQALDRVYKIFRNDVRYTLMRIVEPIAPAESYSSEMIAGYEREARYIADDYIEQQVETLTSQGATTSGDVRVTQPATGITQIAHEFGADMIAMTTHGRTGMGRFLLGSVAERVLRDADKPVMLLRGDDPDE